MKAPSIFENENYKDLTSNQIKQSIQYLKDNNYEFNLTANIEGVSFNPILPENLKKSFSTFTMFSLVNFTFTSLKIYDNHIEFEAGFGPSNFGSVCTVPYYAILQLSIEDSIIFINPTASVEKFFQLNYNQEEQEKRSKNAFKLNR